MASLQAIVHPTKEEFYLPRDERLRALVPYTEVKLSGVAYDAYPHATDVTRLARNIGYTVPAPVLVHYPWDKTVEPAFETQKITAALLTMNPRAYVLSEMGTGKTRSALFAADWMLRRNEIKGVIIVAPLSTLEHVWGFEIMKHFPDMTYTVLDGNKKRRLKRLKEKHDVYIINHHGLKVILDELKALAAGDYLVIIDELATFRNKGTDLWESANALISRVKYAWGMTGSPMPGAPTDAWGQVKLLTPNNTTKYFGAFKRDTMIQVSQFRWIAKREAIDTVFSIMQPAVRFKRDDCVELPPVSYVNRTVAQSPQQERVYKELIDKARVMIGKGDITAVNSGVLFSKLLQIASGWVYTVDRDVVDLAPANRLEVLEETIEEAEGKIIVFADFVHTAANVHAHLISKKIDAVLVTGDTPTQVRNSVFGRFQRSDSPRVIVAHPKCMAHGLTLTEASVIIWYTPCASLEIYEQACARITRPGQKRKQLFVHLTGTSIESKVYRRLKDRASTQDALLELFSEIS